MIENILSRLNKVKKSGAQSWRACCPAHGGTHQNLALRINDVGVIEVKCFSHLCEGREIMASIGLTLADLYPDRIDPPKGLGRRTKWNPYEVLACVSSESLLVAHFGSELQTHPLSEIDRNRLFKAVNHLRAAAKLAGVHHD